MTKIFVCGRRRVGFHGPVRYVCVRCGNCCRWPGLVRVSEAEIREMAAYLGMSEWDFIQKFTRLRPSRDGLALEERPDGSCIFLEGVNVCTIQAVKPRQCREFPNGWNFPGWRDVCEAIDTGGSGPGPDGNPSGAAGQLAAGEGLPMRGEWGSTGRGG